MIKNKISRNISYKEKYNIKKLLSFKSDKTELEQKLKEYEDKFNNLEHSVLSEYKSAIS